MSHDLQLKKSEVRRHKGRQGFVSSGFHKWRFLERFFGKTLLMCLWLQSTMSKPECDDFSILEPVFFIYRCIRDGLAGLLSFFTWSNLKKCYQAYCSMTYPQLLLTLVTLFFRLVLFMTMLFLRVGWYVHICQYMYWWWSWWYVWWSVHDDDNDNDVA